MIAARNGWAKSRTFALPTPKTSANSASFAGLLWSPEVRQAGSLEELLNRIAMCSYAPQMCLNPWPIPHTLWEQYEREKNKNHELLPPEEH